MSFKYKAVQKTEPGVKGGGTKKWYASAAGRDEIDIDRLSRTIERMSTLSLADIRAVIIARLRKWFSIFWQKEILCAWANWVICGLP